MEGLSGDKRPVGEPPRFGQPGPSESGTDSSPTIQRSKAQRALAFRIAEGRDNTLRSGIPGGQSVASDSEKPWALRPGNCSAALRMEADAPAKQRRDASAGGQRLRWHRLGYLMCLLTSLVISNILTGDLPPKIFFSFSSA